jgi:thiol-disulfide isomerase/thioredoxin
MNSKHILAVIIFLFCSNAIAQKELFDFTVSCHFTNDFAGYIYLDYENKMDSCLVVNNHFSFKGKTINRIVGASFNLKFKPSGGGGLYIDSNNIELEMSTEERLTNDGQKLTFFTIESIKGSEIAKVVDDYYAFLEKNSKDKDYKQKLYKKVEAIIVSNPKSPFAGSIISGLTRDDSINKNDLKSLYAKIDKESQSEMTIKLIERDLFPETFVKVNGDVFNFTLPDRNDKSFTTLSLKGKWFLIDFWASWCGPCREQLPELKQVYEANKSKNFEVVGVSIDEQKKRWINALDKEQLQWINVIEPKHFFGTIIKKYNVFGVPANFLINPEGKVVAKNISMQELEKLLKTL